ncbi:MAG: twin-arginine translocation signal domain-containing protein [Mariniblastus sp.]
MPKTTSSNDFRLDDISRREFLAKSAAATAAVSIVGGAPSHALGAGTSKLASTITSFNFEKPDSLFHGHEWETLNPGYWKIENGALRRRLKNYGDRARHTGFPYHAETHGFKFETDYDPSLRTGVIYSPIWDLNSGYSLKVDFTFRGPRPVAEEKDNSDWQMYQDGFGLMGVAIGAKSVYESYTKIANATQIGWTDDGQLKILAPSRSRGKQSGVEPIEDKVLKSTSAESIKLAPGDQCQLKIVVAPINEKQSSIKVTFVSGEHSVSTSHTMPTGKVEGYVGIASRGLIDFEVNHFKVDPGTNKPRDIGVADCLVCYPLGDTLKKVNEKWQVRFVGMFASDGDKIEIRVSDAEKPESGWESVAVCGTAKLVNNAWRKNTSVVEVMLPFNPAEKTLYYTVWKDGQNVTADGRVGTDACGPGTGLVGDVPGGGNYVGRLPRLVTPYKLCGLSCHAINSGLQERKENGEGWKMSGGRDRWLIRDQPSVESYKHLEDYNFQIMVWEDDVWYMELVMYPPSTDDAYKIVALSICGPTSRWQMMRHWNVINPGDHDYGMDDVKGPEQIAIRKTDGLGQDPAYMRRNFQIVHHLTTGAEDVDPYENPKKWRSWKMPNRDFTFVILDSRLWRSSQDVDMWDDQGWQKFKSLYDRTDPTRSLLGEEQFGWLQELVSTDSSSLICLTGINGMHTIWAGAKNRKTASKDHPKNFSQRDRVTADYAGWVKAGADRVLELLGGRDGIVSVYGDVHNGCLMKNVEQRVIECSFGPIGRSGGRALIPGFGPKMKDVDERDVEVHSLYHSNFASPNKEPHGKSDPFYWNFLEMEFDTTTADPKIGMRVRNLVDAPTESPRGGGALEESASATGRMPSCKLPSIKTLPNADVYFTDTNGKTVRGSRSDENGIVHVAGLVDVKPGVKIVVNAFDGEDSNSQVIETLS